MISLYQGKSYAGAFSSCVTRNFLILFITTITPGKKRAKDRPFLCNAFQMHKFLFLQPSKKRWWVSYMMQSWGITGYYKRPGDDESGSLKGRGKNSLIWKVPAVAEELCHKIHYFLEYYNRQMILVSIGMASGISSGKGNFVSFRKMKRTYQPFFIYLWRISRAKKGARRIAYGSEGAKKLFKYICAYLVPPQKNWFVCLAITKLV